MNTTPRVPVPANEPVLSYAPGTPERTELKRTLKDLAGRPLEIPLLIGGKEVRTAKTLDVVMPHCHHHVLAKAHQERLPGWEPINNELRSHVRSCLRSGDQQKVFAAVEYIRATADNGAPVLTDLLSEASGISATFEWEQWKKRDPDTAERMKWWVFDHTEEATKKD